jgi:FMN-dependent NADH-azoreductase
MQKLLAIHVSPRGAVSSSRTVSAEFIKLWKLANPDGAVIERDLTQTTLPYLDADWTTGAVLPADQRSDAMKAALTVGDALIEELQAADHIMIATPLYNFTIPAQLKSYIDHVVRMGVTVSDDYVGQLRGRKVTVIIASGGDFSPGARLEPLNFASAYLRHVLGFIGLDDVTIVLAGRTVDVAAGRLSHADFMTGLHPALETAAGVAQ